MGSGFYSCTPLGHYFGSPPLVFMVIYFLFIKKKKTSYNLRFMLRMHSEQVEEKINNCSKPYSSLIVGMLSLKKIRDNIKQLNQNKLQHKQTLCLSSSSGPLMAIE